MVRRRTYKGQAQRHIDAAVEVYCLERDQRLIMIHAERRIVVATRLGVEHRVRRQGAAYLDAGFPQRGDGRLDDVDFLMAERAGLASVRIEPSDRQDGSRQTEVAAQGRVSDAGGLDNRR